ncbi:MAG TPA: hypothetical protein VEG64_02160 [Candidatus Sulfotelmatobacter sp.]|nr:hypothetical protein [Candidatus Sulfotelmatobacter sp.]
MAGSPLEEIREVRTKLQAWLESACKAPDPISRPPRELRELSAELNRVDRALQAASPGLIASAEWKREIESYRHTLQQLRAHLGHFEIILRIRAQQMTQKQTQLNALKSWADLTREIG